MCTIIRHKIRRYLWILLNRVVGTRVYPNRARRLSFNRIYSGDNKGSEEFLNSHSSLAGRVLCTSLPCSVLGRFKPQDWEVEHIALVWLLNNQPTSLVGSITRHHTLHHLWTSNSYRGKVVAHGRIRVKVKFLQTVDTSIYSELRTMARTRGLNVQELLRAVIIPDWINNLREEDSLLKTRSHN